MNAKRTFAGLTRKYMQWGNKRRDAEALAFDRMLQDAENRPHIKTYLSQELGMVTIPE